MLGVGQKAWLVISTSWWVDFYAFRNNVLCFELIEELVSLIVHRKLDIV